MPIPQSSPQAAPSRIHSEPKIKLEGLRRTFHVGGQELTALADFTLTVDDGEFICIVGPSGCGKTTALRIIAGLEQASSGVMEWTHAASDTRPANAMVFQDHSLFPWLTVADNVAYGLEMRGLARKERMARIEPYLKMVGLDKFKQHFPMQLSGGMRQRASLARALATDPQVLLMDEPFAALDAQNKLILQEELLRIWESDRKTVIFITHAIDEAIALGDRIVVMTAAPGRIKEVIDVDFPRPRSAANLRGDPKFARLSLDIWRILENEVQAARALNGD